MLLSSLSILIGAVLMPPEYMWLYSTHIILTCLYLICRKRILVISLTFISFIVVAIRELPPNPLFPPLKKDTLIFVNFSSEEVCLPPDPKESSIVNLDETFKVSVEYFSKNNIRKTFYNFSLVGPHIPQDKTLINSGCSDFFAKGKVVSVTLPDKNGEWWQKKLYINRQDAQLRVSFSDDELSKLVSLDKPFREKLSAQLDNSFSDFSSWRFSKALLLGNNDLWSERDTWVIRTLGLAHLFVVSGLHTGFLFLIGRYLSLLCWKICPPSLLLKGLAKWHLDLVIVLPFLWFYAYVTNWGEPVVRASIMLSLYLLSKALSLKFSIYSIITFTLWNVLIFDPRTILSPGLWLSFSMVYLLVGFYQVSSHLIKLTFLQVMLCTASMVLILGWQESISSASIVMNMLLIPFAALVWFPLATLSSVEVFLVGSSSLYFILDSLLTYVISCVEWFTFNVPLLFFTLSSSDIPKLTMLFLIFTWVYQGPLIRGWVSCFLIWLSLFAYTVVDEQQADFTLINEQGYLVFKKQQELLLSSDWNVTEVETMEFGQFVSSNRKGRFLISPDESVLSPEALLSHEVIWIVFDKQPSMDVIKRLGALQVEWLFVDRNERLEFRFENGQIDLRHSACIYSVFLFKSDTCKRVALLKSVLN